jgi:uridine kinase
MIIGICGGSASGKSHLARQLCDTLMDAIVLAQDSYYLDCSHLTEAERKTRNYDEPLAIDIPLLASHLATLRQGNAISVPQYDFATHQRKQDYLVVEPSKTIIVEGLFTLENELVELFDLKIFVEAAPDIRLMRRIRRDTAERGRTYSDVLDQYETLVKPMHDKHIQSKQDRADIIIRSDDEQGWREDLLLLTERIRVLAEQSCR